MLQRYRQGTRRRIPIRWSHLTVQRIAVASLSYWHATRGNRATLDSGLGAAGEDE
jgi:hypothetical protein